MIKDMIGIYVYEDGRVEVITSDSRGLRRPISPELALVRIRSRLGLKPRSLTYECPDCGAEVDIREAIPL